MHHLQVVEVHVLVALVAAIDIDIAAPGHGNVVDGMVLYIIGTCPDRIVAAAACQWLELLIKKHPVNVGFRDGVRRGGWPRVEPVGEWPGGISVAVQHAARGRPSLPPATALVPTKALTKEEKLVMNVIPSACPSFAHHFDQNS